MRAKSKYLKIGVGSIVLVLFLSFLLHIYVVKKTESLTKRVDLGEKELKRKELQIEGLKEALQDTTVKEVKPVTSLQKVKGKDTPEFWLREGEFIAPEALKIPTITEDTGAPCVKLGSKFTVEPSSSWLLSLKGTQVEMSHPQKIWGKMKAYKVEERIKAEEQYMQIVKGFFEGDAEKYPATTIRYKKVFIGGKLAGMLGTADYTMHTEKGEEKEVTIEVGYAQRAEYGLQWLFLYDRQESGVNKELISLLLKGVKVVNYGLTIEG